jgi:hypothetical protein
VPAKVNADELIMLVPSDSVWDKLESLTGKWFTPVNWKGRPATVMVVAVHRLKMVDGDEGYRYGCYATVLVGRAGATLPEAVCIRLRTDGDVVDLHRRMTGRELEGRSSVRSDEYESYWER